MTGPSLDADPTVAELADDVGSGPSVTWLDDPSPGSKPIPLDRPLERSGFPPWLTATIALFVAFFLFQIVISPIAAAVFLLLEGVSLAGLLEVFLDPTEHMVALLKANTVGQVLALAVPAAILARLHSSRPNAFLRLAKAEWGATLLAFLGILALFPVVQWLASVNDALPIPETIRHFERMMTEPVEAILINPSLLVFNLVTIAVAPAVCEEILFRGYAQRQFERSLGVVGGIVLTGVVFGLYHLQLTKVIPLMVLGAYLAYLSWRTGSLVPPMIVHFVNNGIAVVIGAYVGSRPDIDPSALESLPMPWYAVFLGVAFFSGSVYLLHRRTARPQDPTAEFPTGILRG